MIKIMNIIVHVDIFQNWKEMTHDWMDGAVEFILSAPVRLVFWTILGHYRLIFHY